jgi:hypothetical protein
VVAAQQVCVRTRARSLTHYPDNARCLLAEAEGRGVRGLYLQCTPDDGPQRTCRGRAASSRRAPSAQQ